MRLTDRKLEKLFRTWTDEQLASKWNSIGKEPSHRVKRTGFVKVKIAKFGDQILDEQIRRRRVRETEAAVAATIAAAKL